MRFLIVMVMGLLSGRLMAEPQAAQWFYFSDQLVGEYHIRSGEPLPDVEFLAGQLRGGRPPMGDLGQRFLMEPDQFKRRDMGVALMEMFKRGLPKAPHAYVTIYRDVYLGPYDFETGHFGVCFDFGGDRCQSMPKVTLEHTLGASRYELKMVDTANVIFFAPPEDIARSLEALAASRFPGRHLQAAIRVKITGTTSRPYRDGQPYRSVLGDVVGVHFLRGRPRDLARGPAEGEILYSIWSE